MFICIAGKNQCAVDTINFLLNRNISKKKLLILPNYKDNGKDGWQPSLKKVANKNKLKIINLKNLYSINDLFFFSMEYEKIIDIKKFKTTPKGRYFFLL